MNEEQKEFSKNLQAFNRYACLKQIKEMQTKKDIPFIYEQLLTPTLSQLAELGVWQEHAMTSIVMNCIDICYLKVWENKADKKTKKVLVLCPEEEYHEIGARMINDYFVLMGFATTYIGCNVPKKDIFLAIEKIKPDYLAISVTNYYNLFKLKTIIADIKKDNNIKIIVGGKAFVEESCYQKIGADFYAKNYLELKKVLGDE